MIRSFLPVGQGAFYHEQFDFGDDKINIIYDCGSSSGKSLVEKQIRENFSEGEPIHGMFLSHLDSDHINGLSFLLRHCNVKNLFFPFITADDREILRLSYLVDSKRDTTTFAFEFITNPYSAFRSIGLDATPRLYQVMPSEFNGDEQFAFDARRIPSGENVWDILNDGVEPDSHNIDEWVYIPFNFRQAERFQALRNQLIHELGRMYSAEELLEDLKANPPLLNKIKQAYKKIPGSMNTNSMALFSGAQTHDIVQALRPIYRRAAAELCPFCTHTANGCLYTGDYEAAGPQKWEALHDAYLDYLDFIGCVQIPHHGSSRNYNPKFIDIQSCRYYIISAGNKNKYQHPNAAVLRDLLHNGTNPLIVNEDCCSTVHFYISYK